MLRELAKPYIMLDSDGIVKNIAMFTSYEDANNITKAVYGESAFAEEYRYLVAMGDKKVDGVYYNVLEDGSTTTAEYIPSEEENITKLKDEANSRDEMLLDLDYRQTLTELGITEE